MSQSYTSYPRLHQSFPPTGHHSDAFYRGDLAMAQSSTAARTIQRASPYEFTAVREPMSAQPRQSPWPTTPTATSPSLGSGDRAPKDFAKPLTCFYWAHKGYCNKTDDECLYAHRMTGVIAEPPQRVAGGPAVAGKNAEQALAAAREQARILEENRELETALKHRQHAIEQAYLPLQQSVTAVIGATKDLGNLVNGLQLSLLTMTKNSAAWEQNTTASTTEKLLKDLKQFEDEMLRIKKTMHDKVRSSIEWASRAGAEPLQSSAGAELRTVSEYRI